MKAGRARLVGRGEGLKKKRRDKGGGMCRRKGDWKGVGSWRGRKKEEGGRLVE